ncbi:S-layer homology domain-containing protein [uncultured Peptoniphilus sp.]|uniref:S-layer homology domain-containing protein n=1 Tax=uncultured Peptoniphilus sp. TaxID=254354 RepID=UPI0026215033|nr:S-layer homology domain-containing protein [uncultured Peptoniphilus sp.]
MKKKFIAIALSALLLFAPASIFAKSFKDLSKNGKSAWAYEYVEELSKKNILKGYEDGSFKPNNPVSFLEIMQILKTVLNPSQDEINSARDAYFEFVNANGIIDWAKDAVCYNLYQGTITEKTITSAREKGFLENKVYPNRNTIAVYYARAFKLEKNTDTSNLKYKDINNINALTMKYLPNLISANIFTSTGSDGNFNGNFAIRRSEIAVITSRGLAYVSANLDKVKNSGNAPAGEDLLVNNSENKVPEEKKNNEANNAGNNNSILNNEEVKNNTEDLKAAEVGTMVNFKGEVVELIDGGSVKYIRVKVTESDSDKFGPGNIITINTFKAHKLNDLVEGSGIFGENSLTNIKLK